jgi:protein tyrosine phosphatase (PTP) superfamily phosphohydrolase (DUF442 family)
MYELTWITNRLAAGHAPMSHEDLDSIRDQGIDAIINLCGECRDLHELEEQAGFDVYYIPIPDETAPTIEELEKALAWLDEAIYLNKKYWYIAVMVRAEPVHCFPPILSAVVLV